MNITDKNTFINSFRKLEKKTKNFTEIKPNILKEDTRHLTIFRVILGITINQFAKRLELPYSWIYNLEHNNRNILDKTAERYSIRLHKLLEENNLIGNVEFDRTLLNLSSLKGIKEETQISRLLKDLENRDFTDFIELVNEIKERTNTFSHFPSSLILEDSKIILIIRILLGLSQKNFAEKTNMANMTVEELENDYRKIRWPVTARIYSEKIEKLLLNNKVVLEEQLMKKRWERWKNTRKTKEKKEINWKTIRNMDIGDFKKYFNFIKKQTNNFKNIETNLFQKTPQLISIFRILLNLTQRDLDRKLKLKGRVISNYERSVYKTLSIGRAELFKTFFETKIKNQNLQNITTEEAVEKFIKVKESMYTHQNSSSRFLNNWTDQEKRILKELQNLKIKNLDIYPHKTIETKKGKLNVDFLIRYKNNPRILIESTEFHHTRSRKFNYNFKNKLFNLDYRFIKLKKEFPKIYTILIIELDKNAILEMRVKKFIEEETVAINKSFINNYKTNLNVEIIKIIRRKDEERKDEMGIGAYLFQL